MQKLILLTVLFFAYSLDISAQYLSKVQASEDLRDFEETLFSFHPGLNYFTTEELLRGIFDEKNSNLPDSILRSDFFDLIEPIIDTIECGHTNLMFAHKLYKDKEEKKVKTLFPAHLRIWEDRLFFRDTFVQDHVKIPRGTEILEINEVASSEILSKLSKNNKGADGNLEYAEKAWAVAGFKTIYARFYGLKKSHKILVQRPDKRTTDTYTLSSISYDELLERAKKNKKKDPLNLKIEEKNKLAVLSFTSFSNKSLFSRSRKKIKKAFKAIKKQGVKHLIIDLRNNGGGAIANVNNFLSFLLEDKFSLIKQANINKNFNRKDIKFIQKLLVLKTKKEVLDDKILFPKYNKKGRKPSKNFGFDGDLVVLINERSYSASSMFSAIIKSNERGTLIGSTSGGSYYLSFAGFSKFIKLRHSQIRIRIPLIRMEYNVKPDMQDKCMGLLPDIEQKLVYKDLVNENSDAVLELAKQFLLNEMD